METLPDLLCYRGETNEPLQARFRAGAGMRMILLCVPVLTAALCACSANAPQQPDRNGTNHVAPAPIANAADNVVLPDDRSPLIEPKGPIDPKSAEAAGQIVQYYGALIEQHRFTEAEEYWSNGEGARQFALQLKLYPEAHLEIGEPGALEGAAGSIYVTVPVTFYGRTQDGADFRRGAGIILRRVNDVPGSSDAQRRWHIERVEWKRAA